MMDDYQKRALEQGLEDSWRMGGEEALVDAYYAAQDDPKAAPEVAEWIRLYALDRIGSHLEKLDDA